MQCKAKELGGNKCKHPASICGYCMAHFWKEKDIETKKSQAGLKAAEKLKCTKI